MTESMRGMDTCGGQVLTAKANLGRRDMIAEAHTPSGHLLGLGGSATVLGFWRYATVQRNHKNLEGPTGEPRRTKPSLVVGISGGRQLKSGSESGGM